MWESYMFPELGDKDAKRISESWQRHWCIDSQRKQWDFCFFRGKAIPVDICVQFP